MEQIHTAAKEKQKEKVWQMWLTLYPHMEQGTIQYKDPVSFYDDVIKPAPTLKDREEIMADVDAIRKAAMTAP